MKPLPAFKAMRRLTSDRSDWQNCVSCLLMLLQRTCTLRAAQETPWRPPGQNARSRNTSDPRSQQQRELFLVRRAAPASSTRLEGFAPWCLACVAFSARLHTLAAPYKTIEAGRDTHKLAPAGDVRNISEMQKSRRLLLRLVMLEKLLKAELRGVEHGIDVAEQPAMHLGSLCHVLDELHRCGVLLLVADQPSGTGEACKLDTTRGKSRDCRRAQCDQGAIPPTSVWNMTSPVLPRCQV